MRLRAMKLPTQEQIERYIKFADAELGPESSDEWVKTIRHILRDLASGRAKIVYDGVGVYQWGGGGGNLCHGGCQWQILPEYLSGGVGHAGNILIERCAVCGSTRSIDDISFGAGGRGGGGNAGS
jgi:hypothetical protein